MQKQDKLAFSKDEVAESIGVSKDSVDRAIRRGELKSIRFGRRVLIPKSELTRLLDARK
jgi:excisionase family DNA binding protein